jgi:hypothetical protein
MLPKKPVAVGRAACRKPKQVMPFCASREPRKDKEGEQPRDKECEKRER